MVLALSDSCLLRYEMCKVIEWNWVLRRQADGTACAVSPYDCRIGNSNSAKKSILRTLPKIL